jgi:hypothetical protein
VPNYLKTMSWRHMGEWRYNSTFLDIGTSWKWVVSFTPLPLHPRGKIPRYPLHRRLGGPYSRSWRCGEEKSLTMLGIEPGPSLYRLSYPDSDNVTGGWIMRSFIICALHHKCLVTIKSRRTKQACSTHGGGSKCTTILVRIPEAKK